LRLPVLSVVIPVYNREREVRRAVESCLGQEGADFELIVVDDASRDRSAAVVAEYTGRGVRLIRHPVNLGSSPARSSGIRAAAGDWIVRLDSDDELVAGALREIQRCAGGVPETVGRLGFMYRYPDGRESPFPPPCGEILDYEGFVAWLERSEMYDCLTVTRRSALQAVPLPIGRLMEMLHHLDFARRFDTLWVRQVGATYHLDARERQSKARSPEEARQDADEIRLVFTPALGGARLRDDGLPAAVHRPGPEMAAGGGAAQAPLPSPGPGAAGGFMKRVLIVHPVLLAPSPSERAWYAGSAA
jgi:hypothetical protein